MKKEFKVGERVAVDAIGLSMAIESRSMARPLTVALEYITAIMTGEAK
jgi:hypothetical protein